MLKNAELIMHTGSAAVDSTAMNTAAFSSYKQELCARIQSCTFDVPSLQITAVLSAHVSNTAYAFVTGSMLFYAAGLQHCVRHCTQFSFSNALAQQIRTYAL
jgi:hypothetical protein